MGVLFDFLRSLTRFNDKKLYFYLNIVRLIIVGMETLFPERPPQNIKCVIGLLDILLIKLFLFQLEDKISPIQ